MRTLLVSAAVALSVAPATGVAREPVKAHHPSLRRGCDMGGYAQRVCRHSYWSCWSFAKPKVRSYYETGSPDTTALARRWAKHHYPSVWQAAMVGCLGAFDDMYSYLYG